MSLEVKKSTDFKVNELTLVTKAGLKKPSPGMPNP